MQGEFKCQNYFVRWLAGLPPLAIYIFFLADLIWGEIRSDILYYILNVVGLILVLAIYYGITRKTTIFIHMGRWNISGDRLTIVMSSKVFDVKIGEIAQMSFITSKYLFRFVARFNLLEIRTGKTKIKIYSPDLDDGTSYASDLFSLYQTVKSNARHLKIDTEISGKNDFNEWLKEKR
ncbi:MAG: hypothetical protein LUD79_03195 [Oscillospiraceae bacterium]|nr:hypothetical protein [Oscillospiraceae bacterium]